MLYVGTTNPGKISEIAAMLEPLQVAMQTVSLDVPETKDDFDENALEKAMAYAAHTGGVTICEDSGLVVPALDGLPGPWSARFADCVVAAKPGGRKQVLDVSSTSTPRQEMDAKNNARVLSLMDGIDMPRRGAYFIVSLIVRDGNFTLFRTRQEYHGWIAEQPRGEEGFGYDPIFVGHDTFGKTLSELDPVRKNLRSHRKRAMDELFAWLSQNRERLTGSYRGGEQP
jgi:XTP/dITP diphosphohydrolase